jgi:hypothetical protein
MTTDNEINDTWKRTDTDEIDALVRQMQKAAEEADHESDGGDLSELTFLASKAGYLTAKRH